MQNQNIRKQKARDVYRTQQSLRETGEEVRLERAHLQLERSLFTIFRVMRHARMNAICTSFYRWRQCVIESRPDFRMALVQVRCLVRYRLLRIVTRAWHRWAPAPLRFCRNHLWFIGFGAQCAQGGRHPFS